MSGSVEPRAINPGRDVLARAVLVVNAGLALALAAAWVQLAVQGAFWRADFTCYYLGGSMVLDGRGDRLYDRDLQTRYQERIAPQREERGGLLAFNNPPHLAIPAALLALLPRELAFSVWTVVQLLLLGPLTYFLYHLTPDHRPLPFAVLLATVLAFPPLFQSFQLGQVSLLVLVCLLGFTWNLLRGRPLATALWLTLGTIKPQIMVAPVAILFAQRRWRELGIAAGLFASWALLTTGFLGFRCWFDFANMLHHSATQFGTDGIHPLAMYNLKGFLTSVLGDASAARINVLSAAALLLAVLVILALARKPLRSGTAAWDLRLALALQLGLIVNPHFNPADVVTLIAPAVLFYRGLWRCGQPRLAVEIMLVCAPLLFALDCYGIAGARPATIHLFFVFMVALAVLMASTAVRSPEIRTSHSG